MSRWLMEHLSEAARPMRGPDDAVQGAVDYFAFRNNPALAGVVNPPRQGNLLNLEIQH